MTERLEMLFRLLPADGIGIIDVGTDHGLIPVKLAESGYGGRLFASDICEGPLQHASAYARQKGLENRIRFLLCDGLEACPPDEIDSILIAGMGGDTICGILDRAEWLFDRPYQLVLQPMTRQEVLRYWLIHNEFRIHKEVLIREGSHLYQAFTAMPGKSEAYSDAEYLTGSLRVSREGEPLSLLLEQQKKRLREQLDGIQRGSAGSSARQRFYETILHQMEQMP